MNKIEQIMLKIIQSTLLLSLSIVFLSCEKQELHTPEIESKSFKSVFAANKKSLKATLISKETDFEKRAGHTSLVFQNQMWVLGGTSGGVHKNDVWSSNDGASWQPVTEHAKFPPRYDHASTVFQDKLWVIGGRGAYNNDVDQMNDVWSSANGKDWELITNNAPFAKRFWHTLTTFNGCLWLIGGWSGSETYGDIWRSCDGKNWVQMMTNAPFGKRRGHAAIVFDNKLWIVGGSKGNNSNQPLKNDVWYTTNGNLWFQTTDNASFPPRRNHTMETSGELMWLTSGQTVQEGQIFVNDIWYSKNGLSWFEAKTSKPFPSRVYHTSIMFNEQLFVINGLGLNDGELKILSDIWSFGI